MTYAPTPSAPTIWVNDNNFVESAIPVRPWLAGGTFLRGALTLLIGAPGASKSGISLAFAVSLVLGKSLGKFKPPRKFRCIVFNAEDEADEQHRRIAATLRQFDAAPADLEGRLLTIGPERAGTLFDQFGAPTPAMDLIEAEIACLRADLAIFDPLVELHSAEENDNTSVRLVMAAFRALAVKHNMAIMLVHHTRKGIQGGAGDPDTARGASAIIGAVRIALTVTTMTDDEAKSLGIPSDCRKHYFRLDSAKSNYAALHAAEWFERVNYHLDNGDTVAAPVPWKPPTDVITADTITAIAVAVEKGSPSGEPWSSKLSDDPRSIRKLLQSHGVATAAGQRKAIASLMATGFELVAYRSATRNKSVGLRSPDGLPAARWVIEDIAA